MDLFVTLILFRIKLVPSRHLRCPVTRVTLSFAEPVSVGFLVILLPNGANEDPLFTLRYVTLQMNGTFRFE